jgi:hypothetical protein
MNWLKSIPAFFQLFKEGNELANAATWKNRTIATNVCVAFFGTLLALAKNFGHDFPIDQETLASLGAGVVAAVAAINAIMHTITSARVGLPSDSSGSPAAGQSDNADKPTAG